MKRNLQALAVMATAWIGVMSVVLTVHPQGVAPAAPATAQAPPPGGGARGQRGGPTQGTEEGIAQFQLRCSVCHNSPTADLAPPASTIREMTPERIFAALTGGSMAEYADGLSEHQRRRIAEFMAGRPLGSSEVGSAALMPNKCTTNPPMTDPSAGPGWNGWSNNPQNTRFQTAQAAGLSAAQVGNLKLKWAFGFPAGESANGQPTVVSGRVFVGSDNGFVYSLDAATGCVYWSYENGSIVRGSVTVGPITGHGDARFAAYFGDGHANVYAVDARNGSLLWKRKVDSHFVARITAGTKLYEGKLLVPVSSSEEFRSGIATYPCCTSRGSVAALNANTGEIIWKAWVVPDQPQPYLIQSNGVVLYKPGGGAVWNTPTVDPVRQAVYFGTGDATTYPSPLTTDGVMAVDLNTGKLLWAYQADADDVFMGGCGTPQSGEQCPTPNGPDLDIGNSPILATMPNGRRVLFGGTKRGHVFALDPDNNGALLYRVLASTGQAPPAEAPRGRGGGGGTIVWGGAADNQHVYYGAGGAGLAALRLATGQRAWGFTPPAPAGGGRGGSLGAAPTAIPGVVFEGASNGMLYAVSSADGKVLWEFNTAQDFQTVNRVPAKGGAITSSGAVIANGMVFVGSGYAISSANSGGNVLLAFSPD